uniref:Large ribosomal subunit protein bL32m n=1 Tax=Maconellicoccus hirsutus TaxID=177089 RepID=A2I442_MACHI|nr:mitochondrial ribosomal protein L32-like protein [Maconellicoccus hirsutus]
MLSEIILKSFRTLISDIERVFIGNRGPTLPALNFIESNCASVPSSKKQFSIQEFMQDGFLWGVPKKRLTIERRKKRMFGSIDRYCKTVIPKTDILVCIHCGHDYERNHLCPNCYAKVKKETEEMQEAILKDLGLSPVEQDVVVLYEGEKETTPSEYWEGKRIIELPKPRPPWFSRNLLQKSTTTTSELTDVQPDKLG